MYTFFLVFHSHFRWLVLVLGFAAVGLYAFRLWFGEVRGWESRIGGAYVGTLHTQLLLGVLLYFISPWTMGELPEGWMGEAVYRFRVLEHPVGMFIAIVVAQAGRSLGKRRRDRVAGRRIALLAYSISLALIVSNIPWQRL